MQAALLDLIATHDEVVLVFQAVPNESLNWRPNEDEFSVKQILVHLTHANDFYLMIVEEAFASSFGIVCLHMELPGWQRMGVTDAEAWQCTSVAELYDCFERAFQRLLLSLKTIADEDLDRLFAIYEFQSTVEVQTTLRQRVIQMAAGHIREHQEQLSETFRLWRTMYP